MKDATLTILSEKHRTMDASTEFRWFLQHPVLIKNAITFRDTMLITMLNIPCICVYVLERCFVFERMIITYPKKWTSSLMRVRIGLASSVFDIVCDMTRIFWNVFNLRKIIRDRVQDMIQLLWFDLTTLFEFVCGIEDAVTGIEKRAAIWGDTFESRLNISRYIKRTVDTIWNVLIIDNNEHSRRRDGDKAEES